MDDRGTVLLSSFLRAPNRQKDRPLVTPVGSAVALTCWPDPDNLVVDLISGSKVFVDGERLLNRKRLTLAAFGVIALGLLAAAAVLALR